MLNILPSFPKNGTRRLKKTRIDISSGFILVIRKIYYSTFCVCVVCVIYRYNSI